MSEIAGVAAGLLRLLLAVGEKLINFFCQRTDLQREAAGNPRLRSRPDGGDVLTNPTQRPESVERLQRGQDQQADAEREETPKQGRAQLASLRVNHFA